MVYRQPFPGPGLGVRCLGAITRDRLEAVRESDAILREEFARAGLDKKVWQYFTVVPDFKSVGMKNNARVFEYMVIIRAINTVDAMTASVAQARTSSLNNCFRGSTSSNSRSSGRPPTLWWDFTVFAVFVPLSMMSG